MEKFNNMDAVNSHDVSSQDKSQLARMVSQFGKICEGRAYFYFILKIVQINRTIFKDQNDRSAAMWPLNSCYSHVQGPYLTSLHNIVVSLKNIFQSKKCFF